MQEVGDHGVFADFVEMEVNVRVKGARENFS
jgi:hypothetical protein